MAAQKIVTRDFGLTFLSQFAFSFAFSSLLPTLPIYLAKQGSKEEAIGILIGALSVASMVLRPTVGKMISRIPEKRFMIAGALLSALTSVAYLFSAPFWPFLAVRVLHGIGFGLFSTASNILIANMSPESRRGQTLSYYYLSQNIPFALAPALGMFVINRFSFTLLFGACTGLYILSMMMVAQLGPRQVSSIASSPSTGRSLIRDETFFPCMLVFLVCVIWGTVTTFFPLFALDQGVGNPGFFFSAFGITLISTRLLAGRLLDLYRRERVMLPCLVIYTASMLLLAFSRTLPLFIITAVLWGFAHALLYPSLVAMAIERATSARGLGLAIFIAAGDLGTGLGPVMMGVILRLTGYPMMFLCLAFIGIITIAYFLVVTGRKQRDSA